MKVPRRCCRSGALVVAFASKGNLTFGANADIVGLLPLVLTFLNRIRSGRYKRMSAEVVVGTVAILVAIFSEEIRVLKLALYKGWKSARVTQFEQRLATITKLANSAQRLASYSIPLLLIVFVTGNLEFTVYRQLQDWKYLKVAHSEWATYALRVVGAIISGVNTFAAMRLLLTLYSVGTFEKYRTKIETKIKKLKPPGPSMLIIAP